MENKILAIYAESQVHAGKGSDVGIVDLPIQREKTTGFPIIQGIKGAIRASGLLKAVDKQVFGKAPNEPSDDLANTLAKDVAGSVAFSEAKILAFPVRSSKSVFLWVTCPMVLARLSRALSGKETNIPKIPENQALVSHVKMLENNKVSVEEIEIDAKFDKIAEDWAKKIAVVTPAGTMKEHFEENFAIVSDKTFKDLVATSTEVIPRIRVDEKTGTVVKGALWYEEYLPQDTLMYCVLRDASIIGVSFLEQAVKALDGKMITIGGNETVGKGLVFLKVMGG